MFLYIIVFAALATQPKFWEQVELINLTDEGPPEKRVAFFKEHINRHGDNTIRVRLIIMPKVIIHNIDESGSRICKLYNCFFKFESYQ